MDHDIRNEGTFHQATFGLISWLEETKITLPLRAVDCRFHVCGDLLGVELDQVFVQNNSKALDCVYTFPLPAGAAVYRCEMHVNGRVIHARVEEEASARALAREHKAAGHRTALVEMDRENLFTLSLGNVQPGDVLAIRFAYFQTVTRLEDWTSFQIPFCPGVRYIPGKPLLRSPMGKGTADDTDQVPDASRISPPRLDDSTQTAASLFFSGSVEDPSGRIRDLSSPSHPLVVRNREMRFNVGLLEAGNIPDQNFVLRWTEEPAKELEGVAWCWTEGLESYAMLRITPPSAMAEEETPQVAAGRTDIYFLLDRSGSMEGEKWVRTAEAFLGYLKGVSPEDRIWLTLFESQFQDWAEKPMAPASFLADERALALPSMEIGEQTAILPALVHVCDMAGRHSVGRRAVVVLITDGQIGNEAEVLKQLERFPEITLHVLGIDTAPNDAFMKALSEQHGGSWHLVHPNDDIAGTVSRLARRLRPAALESFSVSEDWESVGRLPNGLAAGQSATFLLRTSSPEARDSIELRGIRPGNAAWSLKLALAANGSEAVQKLWQRGRLDFLIRQGRNQEAISLAKQANLICSGTAFIAWEDQETVEISQKEIQQPVASPRGRFLGSASSASVFLFDELEDMHRSFCMESRLGFSETDSMSFERTGSDERFFLDLRELQLLGYVWAGEDGVVWSAWREFITGFLSWLRSVEASRFELLSPEWLEILGRWPAADAVSSPDAALGFLAWVDRVGLAAGPDFDAVRADLLALKRVMREEGIPVA